MTEEYEKMTVAELKVLLKEAGLPISGKKADLIERLAGAQEVEEETQEVVEEATEDDWTMSGMMKTANMSTSQSKNRFFLKN